MQDCILWEGAVNSGGYPVTWYKGAIAYAHRIVAGAEPGEVVLHTCDHPLCVNPDHLKIGTHADNSADMVAKNRQAKGEQCGNSKLTELQVRNIKVLKGVMSSRKVANAFGISATNVKDIWNKKIWRHIEDPEI